MSDWLLRQDLHHGPIPQPCNSATLQLCKARLNVSFCTSFLLVFVLPRLIVVTIICSPGLPSFASIVHPLQPSVAIICHCLCCFQVFVVDCCFCLLLFVGLLFGCLGHGIDGKVRYRLKPQMRLIVAFLPSLPLLQFICHIACVVCIMCIGSGTFTYVTVESWLWTHM